MADGARVSNWANACTVLQGSIESLRSVLVLRLQGSAAIADGSPQMVGEPRQSPDRGSSPDAALESQFWLAMTGGGRRGCDDGRIGPSRRTS